MDNCAYRSLRECCGKTQSIHLFRTIITVRKGSLAPSAYVSGRLGTAGQHRAIDNPLDRYLRQQTTSKCRILLDLAAFWSIIKMVGVAAVW